MEITCNSCLKGSNLFRTSEIESPLFVEKYQSSNATLVFYTNMPKFELIIEILASSGETSMSH